MPLVVSAPVQVNFTGVPAAPPAPVRKANFGAVAVGATVSSTIVSEFGADQLPFESRHLTRTVFVPFVAVSDTCCSGQYGRSTHVRPSVDRAIVVTPWMSVAGMSTTG